MGVVGGPEPRHVAGPEGRIAVLCADFHSPYKVYFRRTVGAFRRSAPWVLCWSEGADAVEGLRVERVGRAPFEAPVPGARLRRLLRRSGLPVSEAWRSESRQIRDLLQGGGAEAALLMSGFVADRAAGACRAAGVPYAVQLHGADLHQGLASRAAGRRLLRVLQGAAVVVGVGRYMVDALADLGLRDVPVEVVPLGAPVSGRPIAGPVGPGTRCIFIGRLIAYKAVDVALRALARCRDRGCELSLSVVGEGPQRAALEELSQSLGIGDRVVFHGTLSPEGVAEEIDRSGFLVSPSVDEPGGPEAFGVVVTEAMAASRPALVSRCGGLVDQVRDGREGFVVEQRDVEGLATAMERLAGDSALRERLGVQARERAVARFDSEDLASRLEDIVLGAARRP